MKIIATISGTPNATLKNAARCPDWVARSARPRIRAATNPTRPASSARSAPTGNPSSRRDTHARTATSTTLVASTTTANTIPFTPTSNYSGAPAETLRHLVFATDAWANPPGP